MLWSLLFGAYIRVQNFELHALCEKHFKNKRFVEILGQWLMFMN